MTEDPGAASGHAFDERYWDQHWQHDRGDGPGSTSSDPANPYLARELGRLRPGTALDAGCGAGAEALWLARNGWRVTAVDVSAEALSLASARAATSSDADRVEWVRADLTVWEPGTRFDLVTTHYAHPPGSQLAFYDRLAGWVAPGGTLLVVGHLAGDHGAGHGHAGGHGHRQGHCDQGDHSGAPPPEAAATAAAVTARLDAGAWEVVTAEETRRTLRTGEQETTLHDVVVRATRRV